MSNDYIPTPDEQRLLYLLADMVDAHRAEKRRLEFELRLFHLRGPVTQNGGCLN